jgi:hypothetical protein
MKGVTSYSEIQEHRAEHGSGTQPDPGVSRMGDIPALPPPDMRESHKAHNIQLWISLLVVICLGGLGSLSLVPSMLPGLIHNNNTADRPIQTTYLATPILPTPTPFNGPFIESECTATPKNTKYLSSSGSSGQALPLEWLQAGRDQKDFANAQACAATFINTYLTFNAANPITFEASVPMLTDGAKQRFYGNAPNTQPNSHMDPMWRAALLKQQIQQSAQSSQPGLLGARYTNGKLLVWMVVSCQVMIQAAGSKPVIENDQYTVLLLGVPINTQKTGTGWQVSQWQEGCTQFVPPHLL